MLVVHMIYINIIEQAQLIKLEQKSTVNYEKGKSSVTLDLNFKPKDKTSDFIIFMFKLLIQMIFLLSKSETHEFL